jgi:hypothetical protein
VGERQQLEPGGGGELGVGKDDGELVAPGGEAVEKLSRRGRRGRGLDVVVASEACAEVARECLADMSRLVNHEHHGSPVGGHVSLKRVSRRCDSSSSR